MSDLAGSTARANATVYHGEFETPPPRRPLAGYWDFMVRGWRPGTSWACILILLVHGVYLPVGQFHTGQPITGPDALFYGALVLLLKLAHDRRRERQEGITS